MNAVMTKSEEIAHYRQFVEALPRTSYLADLLAGTADQIEQAIRNDFCLTFTLPQLWAQRQDAQRELAELRKQLSDAHASLRSTEALVDRRREELAEIRRAASRLAATT